MKKGMLSGTTESGFKFEIPANALDNYELIEMIAELDGGNIQYLPGIFATLLGPKQKKALVEHLRGEDGIVSMTAMSKAFIEIMNVISEGKKS